MGYWGYEPKHGDGPQDNWYTVQKAAVVILKNMFNKKLKYGDERWDRIGALQVALEAGMWIPKSVLLAAVSDCDHLQNDEFIESFVNQEAAIFSLAEVRKALMELVSITEDMNTEEANLNLLELEAKRDTLLPADAIRRLEIMGRRREKRIPVTGHRFRPAFGK